MSRKKERQLIFIMGIWQILDGLITILIYGFYQNQSSLMFGTTFIFICTFGTLLIALGGANILISKRYIKDNEVSLKISFFLIAQGIFSYLILDIVSLVLAMSSGVIMLAKNKVIKVNTKNDD